MSSSSSRAAAVLLAALLGALPASAEPSPKDVEAAKTEFVAGLDSRDKGDAEGALAHFRAAYGLVPTPITALEVGKTELALGRVAAAHATFASAAALPPKEGESAKAKDARAEAAKLAAETQAKLARVRLAWEPASPAPEIAIDGRAVPADASAGPHDVDPGHHVVTARGGGKVAREEIDVREGEERAVTLAMQGEPGAAPRRRLRPGPLVWIGFGAAAAGLAVGAVTGIAAFAATGTVKGECPQKACPPSARGDIDTSAALGWTSTVAFVVAGVGAALGVVGLALSPRVEVGPAAARLVLAPGAVGVEGTLR